MANKVNAPDGWYDGVLASASTKELEGGSLILELEFNIGDNYFYAKESIFLRSAPSGDSMKDANRAEWLKESIERLKDVYPEAVVDGKLVIVKLTNADDAISSKPVRVKVSQNGDYVRAKVFAQKMKKPKISKEDAIKMASKYSRDLAKYGISVDEPARQTVVAGTQSADDSDIPF